MYLCTMQKEKKGIGAKKIKKRFKKVVDAIVDIK